MGKMTDEVATFSRIKDDAHAIVSGVVQDVVGQPHGSDKETPYDPKQVQTWIERINTQALDKLQQLSQSFKLIVSTIVVQKNGAGIHVSSTCFWEQATDGNLTFRWENKSMYVIIQIFGLAL